MSRPILNVLFAASLLAFGCTRENQSGPGSNSNTNNRTPYPPCASNSDCSAGNVCTTIGCCPGCHSDADCGATESCTINPAGNFCSPKSMSSNPPAPTAPTAAASQPGANRVNPVVHCTVDSNCSAGQLCNAGTCQANCTTTGCGEGASCISGRCYNNGASLCGSAGLSTCFADENCGAGRLCVGGSCHAACTGTGSSSCPMGQACTNGACLDAAPSTGQCTFDTDCGIAFRCINAACHPLCSTDTQCGASNFCDHGVCRADYRPVSG